MRILVCSDIHANLAAFEAVLAAAGAVDSIWCLGDVVGYGPEPNECCERVRSLPNVLCLAGNHDWAALGKLDVDDFNSDARTAALWTQAQLTPANRRWLEELPERIAPLEERFTLVHGSPRYPIWEYVLDGRIAAANFAHFDTQICLVGHTHVPAVYQQVGSRVGLVDLQADTPFMLDDARLILNPGGVGQPRDGDPRASLAILDTMAWTWTVHRVDYPIEVTQAKMVQAGLPPRSVARLSFGW